MRLRKQSLFNVRYILLRQREREREKSENAGGEREGEVVVRYITIVGGSRKDYFRFRKFPGSAR
jgi:hypothetical protein